MIARTFSSLPMCAMQATPNSSSARSSHTKSIGRRPASAALSATLRPTKRRAASVRTAADHGDAPVHRDVVEALGTLLLQLGSEPLTKLGAAETRDRLARTSGMH